MAPLSTWDIGNPCMQLKLTMVMRNTHQSLQISLNSAVFWRSMISVLLANHTKAMQYSWNPEPIVVHAHEGGPAVNASSERQAMANTELSAVAIGRKIQSSDKWSEYIYIWTWHVCKKYCWYQWYQPHILFDNMISWYHWLTTTSIVKNGQVPNIRRFLFLPISPPSRVKALKYIYKSIQIQSSPAKSSPFCIHFTSIYTIPHALLLDCLYLT